jgi:long-chain acyl-CoA synthetase
LVPRETLLDFFRDFAVARGEFVVSYDGYRTRRYGYGDVARASRGFAARLQAAGVLPGDRIVLWGGNSAEWLAAFWGCLLAGGVVVPVDERASGGFASRVCATVRPRLLLRGGETRLDDPAGGTEPPGAALVWRLSEIDWADSRVPREVAVSPDDPAEILFTSGATAEPKGVVITHRNVLANIGPVEEAVPRYRRWLRPFFPLRFLDLIPLSHMFGQAMAAF